MYSLTRYSQLVYYNNQTEIENMSDNDIVHMSASNFKLEELQNKVTVQSCVNAIHSSRSKCHTAVALRLEKIDC